MLEELLSLLINSIPGAIAGGLVSFLFEKRKERREDKKEAQKERKEIFQNRPEFKIVDYKRYTEYNATRDEKCDLSVFLAYIKDVSVVKMVLLRLNTLLKI